GDGHGVMRPTGGIERMLGPAGMAALGPNRRRARHSSGRLVHLGEDRVVAGPVAEPLPRPFFAMTGPPRRVDVLGRVDERDLLVGGVAGRGLGDATAVDQAVVVDELPCQDDPGRPKGMLRAVVVPGP